MTLEQKRCPECHLLPEVKIEEDRIWLECERNGHIGVSGRTMDQAIFNWNLYIEFVTREATNEK